jgi:hypothetical protein
MVRNISVTTGKEGQKKKGRVEDRKKIRKVKR